MRKPPFKSETRFATISLILALGFASAHSAFAAESHFTETGVKNLMRKVNTFTKDTPYMETDRNWIRATYYTGVMGAYAATGEEAYMEQALAWGKKHKFRPGTKERPGANILTSSQTYLELYFLKKDLSEANFLEDYYAG